MSARAKLALRPRNILGVAWASVAGRERAVAFVQAVTIPVGLLSVLNMTVGFGLNTTPASTVLLTLLGVTVSRWVVRGGTQVPRWGGLTWDMRTTRTLVSIFAGMVGSVILIQLIAASATALSHALSAAAAAVFAGVALCTVIVVGARLALVVPAFAIGEQGTETITRAWRATRGAGLGALLFICPMSFYLMIAALASDLHPAVGVAVDALLAVALTICVLLLASAYAVIMPGGRGHGR